MANPRKMRELRQARGNRCEECNRSQEQAKKTHKNGLEFAHLITTGVNGRGRGQAERARDIEAFPTHYKLMCKECHRVWDRDNTPALPDVPPF